MAIYAKARQRPLSVTQTESRMLAFDLVILHTMVGYLASTDTFFRKDGFVGLESHFGVGGIWGPDAEQKLNGAVWQWQDTAFSAQANGEANLRAISIETADNAPSSSDDLAPWTSAQCESIAGILAWCHVTHKIPLIPAPNSLPGSKGIGYHRQGIDPWRVLGGEVWSSSRGKVCPGDRRIAQIPGIIARAKQIVSGDDVTAAEVWGYDVKIESKYIKTPTNPGGVYAKGTYDAYELLRGANTGVALLRKEVAGLSASVKTLAELIAKDTEDLSAQQILDTVRNAIETSVVNVNVEVTGEEVP
jgi:N-acetylmuramoyl-L-alanine amidase